MSIFDGLCVACHFQLVESRTHEIGCNFDAGNGIATDRVTHGLSTNPIDENTHAANRWHGAKLHNARTHITQYTHTNLYARV